MFLALWEELRKLTLASRLYYVSRRLNICIQFKIIGFFIITLFAWLYARICIFLTRGNHLYDCIISLMGDIWAHKASLSPPRFIEVPVSSQENEGIMYLWDWYIDFASFYDFCIVPTVGYFYFLFYYKHVFMTVL